MPITHILFSQIQKTYATKPFSFHTNNTSSTPILDNAEIELKKGECILLSGKNGSGKSTLLRILAGLLKPNSATINTGFTSLSWKKANKLIRQHIMYLYQEPYMFDGSVARNLAYAAKGNNHEDQIKQALKWAKLEHRANTPAKYLSGGERQRVALAQAWLKQPSVLLLDEPTANMDEESRHSTEDLLCKFKETGTALLIASHDTNHFNHTMDNRLLLEDGVIIEISDNISIFPSNELAYSCGEV